MADNTPPTRRRWFQFSLGDLFAGVKMFAVGAAGIVSIFSGGNSKMDEPPFIFGVIFASGAMIGAGLLSPFRQKAIGAILGLVLIYPLLLLWLWNE